MILCLLERPRIRESQTYILTTMSNKNGIIPCTPSKDWQLNVFLDQLAKELTDEDFASLKFFCSGSDGIKKSCLSQITKPLELFTVLKERMMITNENLLTLQSMIWHIKRDDLYRKFVEFCKQRDNTLYFFKPEQEAEDGNDHVRFHVRGHRDKSADYLQDLRFAVSRLLLCPPEYIYVAGCEEAESMWVTLLIPARCIDVLLNISNDDWCVLKLLDVDVFVISKLNKEVRSPLIFTADCLEIPNIKADSVLSGKLTMTNNRCGIVHTSGEHPELQNVLEKIRMYEHQQIQQTKETDKVMSPEKSKIHVTDNKNRQRRAETTAPTLPPVHEVTTSTDDARLLLVRETPANIRLHTDSGFQEEQIFSKRHGDLDQN